MDKEQFLTLIKEPQYDFLRTNEHLSGQIMFLTLGGSHSYGTNVEGSDIDIRGCAMHSHSDVLGLTNFEQFVHKDTDTTIYGFRKLVRLLMSCNPNCIEMLGGRPEHYIMVSPAGQMLINHRKIFLSQLALDSFGGYAKQQLNRLKNAVARDRMDEDEKEEHILDACERALSKINGRYQELPEGSIRLYIGPSQKEDRDSEILMDVNLKGYPLRDYKGIWNDLNEIAKNYRHVNNRNKKKDDAHLNKHMMHLIRLYLTLIDILEKGDIITYRGKDLPLLMDIRNGKFMDKRGLIKPEFYELLEDVKKRADYAEKHTELPQKPDFNKVNELVMSVNQMALL